MYSYPCLQYFLFTIEFCVTQSKLPHLRFRVRRTRKCFSDTVHCQFDSAIDLQHFQGSCAYDASYQYFLHSSVFVALLIRPRQQSTLWTSRTFHDIKRLIPKILLYLSTIAHGSTRKHLAMRYRWETHQTEIQRNRQRFSHTLLVLSMGVNSCFNVSLRLVQPCWIICLSDTFPLWVPFKFQVATHVQNQTRRGCCCPCDCYPGHIGL